MCEAVFGGWQGPDKVNMNMRKPPAGHRDGGRRSGHLSGHLAVSAMLAVPAPGSYVLAHALPENPRGHQTLSGMLAWVTEVMKLMKNLGPELKGKNGPEAASGDITVQYNILQALLLNGE